MEVSGQELQSKAIDHHGLVAAICKDIKLADKINDRLFSTEKQEGRVVKPGTSVVAMILNGLGFTNRRLYLTHQFFEGKPVELLLGEKINASDLTDSTLGNTLDEIAAYGTTRLFGEIAFEVALEQNLLDVRNHLDTTSITVHGQYDAEDSSGAIEITHGYSKDHRPDLKQIVMSLVVNGPADIPIWVETLNGNSSDKTSFHETIRKVEDFRSQIDFETPFSWVGDSALYSKEHLLKNNDYRWLTRVPESLSEAKALVTAPKETWTWTDQGNGYSTAATFSEYGGIRQRWLIVFSEQAYERERKTFSRNISKQEKALSNALWHLRNQLFNCEKDAIKSFKAIAKKYPLYQLESEISVQHKHDKAGRPKTGTVPVKTAFQINGHFKLNEAEVERRLCAKGRFILATNNLDTENYTDQHILKEYKSQQNVERGFRFLKDPWFMLDSVFLKLPRRVEALMMIMTLCLLVYNLGQYRLREALILEQETLPNQVGKQIKNPTLRWVFQLMENITLVNFYDGSGQITKQCVTNLTPLRIKIIRFAGKNACEMYGILIQENILEGLGM